MYVSSTNTIYSIGLKYKFYLSLELHGVNVQILEQPINFQEYVLTSLHCIE